MSRKRNPNSYPAYYADQGGSTWLMNDEGIALSGLWSTPGYNKSRRDGIIDVYVTPSGFSTNVGGLDRPLQGQLLRYHPFGIRRIIDINHTGKPLLRDYPGRI